MGGESAAYLEQLYEHYLQDPTAVDPKWRQYFDQLPKSNAAERPEALHSQIQSRFLQLAQQRGRGAAPAASDSTELLERKQIRVLQLIEAYRVRGHKKSNLDPLALYAM